MTAASSYLVHPAPGLHQLMRGRWKDAYLEFATADWIDSFRSALEEGVSIQSPFADDAQLRFLSDVDQHGGCICSAHGAMLTGFEFLAKWRRLTVPEVHNLLYRWLGFPTPNALPPTASADDQLEFTTISPADMAAIWGEQYFETGYPDAVPLAAHLQSDERLSTQIRWHPNVPLPGTHVASPARLIRLLDATEQPCGVVVTWYAPNTPTVYGHSPILSRVVCWSPPDGAHASLYANGDAFSFGLDTFPGWSTLYIVADLDIAPLLERVLPVSNRWRIWWLPSSGLLRTLSIPADTKRVVFLGMLDWKADMDMLAEQAESEGREFLSALARDFSDRQSAMMGWNVVINNQESRDKFTRMLAGSTCPSTLNVIQK